MPSVNILPVKCLNKAHSSIFPPSINCAIESLILTCVKNLILISLLFGALVNTSIPIHQLNFLIFIIPYRCVCAYRCVCRYHKQPIIDQYLLSTNKIFVNLTVYA